MSQETTEAVEPVPEASLDGMDFSSPTPPAGWTGTKGTYQRLHKLAAENAGLRAKAAEAGPMAQQLAEARAQAADLEQRLALVRVGIDDDAAPVVALRYAAAVKGIEKPPALGEWLLEAGKSDKIVGKLYPAAVAASAPPIAAKEPEKPKAPEPGLTPPSDAPGSKSSYSREELETLRRANGGRLPKEVREAVEKDLGGIRVSEFFR